MGILILAGVVIGALALILILAGLLYSSLYKKVNQGEALVVNTPKDVVVSFTGRLIIPVIHKAEVMDISVKTIKVERRGNEGLICKDNIRADIEVNFFVRVNKTDGDVVKVAQAIGVERASSAETLQELFSAKFSEALKTVGYALEFVDLYNARDEFREQIIETIGTDLNGYSLEDVAIDFLEQTPLSSLDENNILDAQGIRKITELTAIEHVATNIAARNEQAEKKKKDVETAQQILELERQEADARAKQEREVATVRAREKAETAKITSEEHLRAEKARIATAQQVEVEEQNRMREHEIAEQNRLRDVAIEAEKVARAEERQRVETEVEVTESRKILESKKAEIADIEATRVATEKAVAVQREEIKTLEVVEEANRLKDATIITAEADAEAAFVMSIKNAEADEQAATSRGKEQITLAEASLKAAELQAQATERQAKATQAEAAAAGLAEAQVKKADAVAIQEVGRAEAEVKKADAAATEEVGLAEVRIKEAEALAVEKMGSAEAVAVQEMGLAEAAAVEKMGSAEAASVEALLAGEARGLTEKADAMAKLEGVGQDFEKFTRQLDVEEKVRLAQVEADVQIASAQAEAVAGSLSNANIDIVGGDTSFVGGVLDAVSTGRRVNALAGASKEGRGDLVDDLSTVLGSISTDAMKDLAIAKGAAEGDVDIAITDE